jgi:predicted DNA-binding transcriptional regulator YafY
MSKLKNIIKLLRLLQEKKIVSLESIMEACNVSERTVYRYIKNLHDANVPIYYDRRKGGYMIKDNEKELEEILGKSGNRPEINQML